MNEPRRIQLVKKMARRILSKAWRIEGLWTTHLEVRTARLRNYEPMPSHRNNRRFERGCGQVTRLGQSGWLLNECRLPSKGEHAMREYLLHRLLLLIPTLLGVTFVVFMMMHFIPGDPVTNMMGETYSADDAKRLRHELGLDQPLVVQYGKWLLLLLRGRHHASR